MKSKKLKRVGGANPLIEHYVEPLAKGKRTVCGKRITDKFDMAVPKPGDKRRLCQQCVTYLKRDRERMKWIESNRKANSPYFVIADSFDYRYLSEFAPDGSSCRQVHSVDEARRFDTEEEAQEVLALFDKYAKENNGKDATSLSAHLTIMQVQEVRMYPEMPKPAPPPPPPPPPEPAKPAGTDLNARLKTALDEAKAGIRADFNTVLDKMREDYREQRKALEASHERTALLLIEGFQKKIGVLEAENARLREAVSRLDDVRRAYYQVPALPVDEEQERSIEALIRRAKAKQAEASTEARRALLEKDGD